MATNSKYTLIKTIRKAAGMQLGPQSGGSSLGGAGGKIPAGFRAGMDQKKEEEALAAKEESESADAKAMDDAAKQQDMQIKQVEMEQRMRDQTSQKMQEMQMEQSRLGIEAANLKEQLKNKDIMHKEQIKHMNDLVKQQMNHQKTLDKQVESQRERMTTPFSTTLVSRSKALRSMVEKLHKQACILKPTMGNFDNSIFMSLCKSANMVPATPKLTPGSGPAEPKTMAASKVAAPNAGKEVTPLTNAPAPAAQPAPSAAPASQFGGQHAFNHPLSNVAERVGSRIDPATQSAGQMWDATWDTAKNLRGDINKGFKDYSEANKFTPIPGQGAFGSLINRSSNIMNRGLHSVAQGGMNALSYPISTAAQGYGHAGEHFKDMYRRGGEAGTRYNTLQAQQKSLREAGNKKLEEQWNKDMQDGDWFSAVANQWNSGERSDSAWQRAKDFGARAGNWGWDQAAAAGQGLKGIGNAVTAGIETGLSATGLGAILGSAGLADSDHSRGWDPFSTDAEAAQQKAVVDSDKKKILEKYSPNTDPAAYSSTGFSSLPAGGNGTNDAQRLQMFGGFHPGYLGDSANYNVNPMTSMMMSPFTQTSGFDMGTPGGPNDMYGAFQNSAYSNNDPGFRGAYNAFDNAYMSNKNFGRFK